MTASDDRGDVTLFLKGGGVLQGLGVVLAVSGFAVGSPYALVAGLLVFLVGFWACFFAVATLATFQGTRVALRQTRRLEDERS